jgi:hypothetical protein
MEVGSSYANNEINQGNHRAACNQTTLSPRKVSLFVHFKRNGNVSIDFLVKSAQSVFSQIRPLGIKVSTQADGPTRMGEMNIFHNSFPKALKVN